MTNSDTVNPRPLMTQGVGMPGDNWSICSLHQREMIDGLGTGQKCFPTLGTKRVEIKRTLEMILDA